MRVVAEQETLAPPFLCFICESHPQRESNGGPFVNVVDTQKDFNPPSLSHLSGRKYICERCAEEAARLLGFVRVDDVDRIQEQVKQSKIAIQRVADFAGSLSKEIQNELAGASALLPQEQLVSIPKSKDVKEAKDGA